MLGGGGGGEGVGGGGAFFLSRIFFVFSCVWFELLLLGLLLLLFSDIKTFCPTSGILTVVTRHILHICQKVDSSPCTTKIFIKVRGNKKKNIYLYLLSRYALVPHANRCVQHRLNVGGDTSIKSPIK